MKNWPPSAVGKCQRMHLSRKRDRNDNAKAKKRGKRQVLDTSKPLDHSLVLSVSSGAAPVGVGSTFTLQANRWASQYETHSHYSAGQTHASHPSHSRLVAHSSLSLRDAKRAAASLRPCIFYCTACAIFLSLDRHVRPFLLCGLFSCLS